MLLTYKTLPYFIPKVGDVISKSQITAMVKFETWEIKETNKGLEVHSGEDLWDSVVSPFEFLFVPVSNGTKYVVAYRYY